MQVVYLPATRPDLQWMRAYYLDIFPAGARYAGRRFQNTIRLLKDNPDIGRPGALPGTKELVIPRTPFLILYRINTVADRIEILRVWDGRAQRDTGEPESQS